MKNRKKNVAIYFFILLCGLMPNIASAKKTKCKDLHYPIYDSDSAPQPYVIVGKVYLEFSTTKQEKILCELMRATQKHGGDAILAYESNRNDTAVSASSKKGFWDWLLGESSVTTTTDRAYGIIIRWAKNGEQGIIKITEATPMPVLY